MKQIILTLAAVAASVTAVSGQGTGVLDRYYIDGLIYGKTSETTVSCAGAFDDGVEKVVIPETINANGSVYTVTSISDFAFEDCSDLYSVTIPGSVTTIGNAAFRGCSGLASVTIPERVTSIGNCAFCYCYGLESVNISDLSAWCRIDFSDSDSNPLCYANNLYLDGGLITDLTIPDGITEIKAYAFYSCNCIASVMIPNSVTTIGDYAFLGCSGLASVTIPNSVTTIGNYAFVGCRGLTSVTIPESVTTIDDYAFYGCSDLASVTIPNSVTTIGSYAFFDCTGLEAVVIGRNVTTIGHDAFYSGESNITRVDILALTPPNCDTSYGEMFFYTVYDDAVLSVPTGSLEAYRSADVWKKFKNIQEKDFGGVDGVEDDAVSVTAKGGSIEISGAGNAPVEVYNLSGQLVYSGTETTVGGLARGIYIVRVAGQTFKVAL